MTLQAQALGLSARQFRAFDRADLEADFGVPDHWEATTMAAYGRAASSTPDAPPARVRRPLGDLVWCATALNR